MPNIHGTMDLLYNILLTESSEELLRSKLYLGGPHTSQLMATVTGMEGFLFRFETHRTVF